MHRNIQYLDREAIETLQIRKLKEENSFFLQSPFYRSLFRQHNVDLSKVERFEDLESFPVTTKRDIQERNDDFIAVPRNMIMDYVTTSGTSGNPVIIPLTKTDLNRLGYNEYLSFCIAGISCNDVLQLMVTIDRRFMAGLAYLSGARLIGAGVIRAGNGNPALQWDTIERLCPTACICVPSFLAKMTDYAQENGIDPEKSSLKKALCIGEPLRTDLFEPNSLLRKISNSWGGLSFYSTYASSEMQCSFTECSYAVGMHHQPELAIIEFLDDGGLHVSPGEVGEVTVTTLGVRGFPLFRFRTGDLCCHYIEKCSCGRTTTRLGPILGRKDQLIKYKGTSLYPSTLFNVLDSCNFIRNYLIVIDSTEFGTDNVSVHISGEHIYENELHNLRQSFQMAAKVIPEIVIDTEDNIRGQQIDMFDRKLKKVHDFRKKT